MTFHNAPYICGTRRKDKYGEFFCKNSYVHEESGLCSYCHRQQTGKPNFASPTEELEFLRGVVSRLVRSQGRETAYASFDLDYAWEMLEEYVETLDPNEY